MAASAIDLRQLGLMLDTGARLLLSPLLVTQALRVRRMAQSLPEASGPRAGTSGQGPKLRLAIVGDSSAAGVGVSTQSEALTGQVTRLLARDFEVTWHLDALTGATTQSTIARLDAAQPQPFDIVITALGVNDVTRLIPAATWVRQQEKLLARLRTLYAPKCFYVSGMPPLEHFPLLPEPLRWTLGRHAQKLERARTAALKTHQDVTLVPFNQPLKPDMMATDGFHPGSEIYRLWGEEMARRIIADRPQMALA